MRLNLYVTYKNDLPLEINQDLVLRAKNTNILDCYFYDEDDLLVDITGSELYFMVKDNPSQVDNDAKLNKKITVFTNPTGGETEIELTSTDTASLLGNYIYQIKMKFSSKWYTLVEGNITFQQNIISRES